MDRKILSINHFVHDKETEGQNFNFLTRVEKNMSEILLGNMYKILLLVFLMNSYKRVKNYTLHFDEGTKSHSEVIKFY